MKDRGIVVKLYRIERYCYLHHLKFFSKLIYGIIYICFNCIIPPTCQIGKNFHIAHSIGIVLHQDTIIGDNCTIYQNSTIGGGRVIIKNNVLIGANSVIQGPLIIQDDCKIGALSFLNFNVDKGQTVIGEKAHCYIKK